MSRALVAAVLLAVTTGSAAAAVPRHGELVPGRSLGGVRLGATQQQVRSALGRDYGVCRGCAATTWYFTYRPFTRSGLAVEFSGRRVSAVWTVWRPSGWRGPAGLRLGAPEGQVDELAGPLVPLVCSGYDALTRDTRGVRSVYYVVAGKLWGFGLMWSDAIPCR